MSGYSSTTLDTAVSYDLSLSLSLSLSAGHGVEPGGQNKSLTEEELLDVN